jgi:hypothetical protein
MDLQDSWIAKEKLVGSEYALFGVFDGHGAEGKVVSAAVAELLPLLLKKVLEHHQKSGRICNTDSLDASVTQSFEECHVALHQQPGLNCSFSGSTCVTALISARRLIIANLGDSRCILGKRRYLVWYPTLFQYFQAKGHQATCQVCGLQEEELKLKHIKRDCVKFALPAITRVCIACYSPSLHCLLFPMFALLAVIQSALRTAGVKVSALDSSTPGILLTLRSARYPNLTVFIL